MQRKEPKQAARIDPLYVIFEQHLYQFDDAEMDRKTFILNVVAEYLGYLRKAGITVPKALEPLVIEELGVQVNSMLVKKIYGCLTIKDFNDKVTPAVKKSAEHHYRRLSSKASK